MISQGGGTYMYSETLPRRYGYSSLRLCPQEARPGQMQGCSATLQ